MGVGKGNVVVVNIYYSLFIFVDEQSTRGEHCRSHTITITQIQGNIELNPLSKNTEVYCCTPIYRFIILPHGG